MVRSDRGFLYSGIRIERPPGRAFAERPRFDALPADAVRCQARGIDDRDGRSRGGILAVGEKWLVKGKNTTKQKVLHASYGDIQYAGKYRIPYFFIA